MSHYQYVVGISVKNSYTRPYISPRGTYRRHIAAMQAQGVTYRPIVWTAWGRAHPDAISTLRSLAIKAARRRGLVSAGQLLAATRLEIALELQAISIHFASKRITSRPFLLYLH